jgi:hypothetical protein
MENEQQNPVDVRDHELGWMFTDATGLFQLCRFNSCLLIILCAVDACARRRQPSAGVRERFESFLRDRLPAFTRVTNFNIMIPQHGEFMRLEEILYRLLRNGIVHEGASFSVDHPSQYSVSLDWKSKATTVRVSQQEKLVVINGQWLVDAVAGVVRQALAEDLQQPAKP